MSNPFKYTQLPLQSQDKHFKEWMRNCPFNIQSVTEDKDSIIIHLEHPFDATDVIIEELVVNDPLFTNED